MSHLTGLENIIRFDLNRFQRARGVDVARCEALFEFSQIITDALKCAVTRQFIPIAFIHCAASGGLAAGRAKK